MEDRSLQSTPELFVGLRPNRKSWNPKTATKQHSNVPKEKEFPKPKPSNHVNKVSSYGVTPSMESIRQEIMSKIATLEASLVAEIHESRITEEKLRNELAKSRMITNNLQGILSKFDTRELKTSNHGARHSETVEEIAPSKSIPRRANRDPPVTSSCDDLRQLARNQVIRCVEDISPQFSVDMQLCSYNGYIPWPRVLQWLEDHPETVDIIGLNLHSLRTI